jgi:Tfp pilus assembly protein PilN
MRFGMDFSKPTRNQLLLLGFLLIGVAGTGHAIWQRQVLLSRLAEESERLSHYDGDRRRQQNKVQAGVDLPAVSAVVDEVSFALRYPWESMLDSLHASVGSGLQLRSIQPDAESGHLQVTGVAANADVFLDYMARLRSEEGWSKVEPVFQDRKEEDGKLVFQLRLEWHQ